MFGVDRVDHFVRSCSSNYKNDCWVLKLDIQGFFMHINKEILWTKLENVIKIYYKGFDKQVILDLAQNVILHNPVPNCSIKGSQKDWEGLPASKSLFSTQGVIGMPIGNLTSQIFANLHLNDFDQFVKRVLKFKYYGRYVDDLVFISTNKAKLIESIDIISTYLKSNLQLELHPNKIYLQHFTKGFLFTGIFIKPYRRYVGKRIRKNLNRQVATNYKQNYVPNSESTNQNMKKWICSINSYLGMCRHYETYKYRNNLKDYIKDQMVQFNEDLTVVKYRNIN